MSLCSGETVLESTVTNSEQVNVNRRSVANVWNHYAKSQAGVRQEKVKARCGTRVPCDIPVTAVSLDPVHPFSESCRVILANPNGCSVRISRAVQPGTPVRLQGLPVSRLVTARVTNCIDLGKYENLWLVGLEIDKPGNVWGIDNVPADWGR